MVLSRPGRAGTVDNRRPNAHTLSAAAMIDLTGTLKSIGFKFGRWLDSVLMQRALGEGGVAPPAGN